MSDPHSLLPLTPTVFHILLAVRESPRHGYAIMRDVSERSDGRVGLGPGSLYGAVQRMVEAGLLRRADPPDGEAEDPRRRYYAITPLGQQALLAETERMAQLVADVRAKAGA